MGLPSVRAAGGSTSRRVPDSNLVGIRYEKTVQAEPPIPLPPRNLSRIPIRTPSIRSPAPSSPSPSLYSPSIYSSHSPVVVAPPLSPLPTVAAPTEQHPALRTPVQQTKLAHEGWKRDSGHAPTPNSSATIHEEDCEDDCTDGTDPASWSVRINELIKAGVVPPPAAQHPEHRTAHGPAQTSFSSSTSSLRHQTVSYPANSSSPSLPSASLKALITESFSSENLARYHSSPPSSQKRMNILKRFSVRSSASAKKGKLSVLISGGSSIAEAPMESLVRGPTPPPASVNKPLQSPVSAETSPLQSWHSPKSPDASSFADRDALYTPLGISIPTDSLIEDEFMANLSFSNRGSIMFGGRRAAALGLDGADDVEANAMSIDKLESDETNTNDAVSRVSVPPPDIRILTTDVEKESQKVRSLYGVGDTINWEDGSRHSYCEPLSPTPEVPAEEDGNDSVPQPPPLAPAWATPGSVNSSHPPDSGRRETELAGGLEDWEDVDGADVDRYGFIAIPRPASRISTPTDLKSAQFSPRRRNILQKRELAGFSSPLGMRRAPSRKVSTRSLNTQNSEVSATSKRSSRSVIRQAGNLLLHSRERRWMDEAGDMLTVPPGLQDAAEEAQVERISETLKRKEWERSEKWRKMAKVVRKGGQGEGIEFEFDIKNPKLIERTWKGIPDRWRAAAWWSFLASSAKNHNGSATEEEIITAFHRLLERGSPDDVQIDLDVPRTISRHIMFRKRYRGGQRLLFRVLHALSIYFPEVGYVQGMASLAATLLCYFDEEKCFVMLVRMWQLRGLDRLYRPGFEGLMTALREFDDVWLNKDVAKKLSELCVDITAYGTRWYLTLFNLSIPFPAQLRVWDVFLLLGNTSDDRASSSRGEKPDTNETSPPSGLDVLHATSAAVIQALREVLLDSDFENAMKALTSWIPIKDEDLLMKVTKAEWKSHHGKKKT